MPFSRRSEVLDRRILGGRLYLGSTLWAGLHLGGGLLLWGLGAYLDRPGTDPRWLLLTLAGVCSAVLLRRIAPGVGLAVASLFLAADIALGPSAAVFIVYGEVLYAVGAWSRRRLAYATAAVVAAVAAAVLGILLYLLAHGVLGGLLDVIQLLASMSWSSSPR